MIRMFTLASKLTKTANVQELPQAVIKDLIKTLNITKKMLVKINSLREQANLSAII